MKCIQEIRRNYMLYGQPAAEEIVIPVSDDAEQERPQSEMDTDAVGQATKDVRGIAPRAELRSRGRCAWRPASFRRRVERTQHVHDGDKP